MNRKFVTSLIILLLLLTFELVFWNQIILLSIIYIVLAYIKHLLYPIKKELHWYLFLGFGGALAEIVLVNLGHGWTYVNPQVLGIPVWIPFFWGLIGTTSIVMYQGLTKK